MQTLARMLAPLITLSLAACGGGESVAGTWKLDNDASVAANEGARTEMLNAMPEESREMAEEAMINMFKSMEVSLTLAQDGAITGVMRVPGLMGGEADESKLSGTWSVDGDQVTIVTKDEDSDEEETMVATWSGDTLTVDMPDEEGLPIKMVYSRE